MELLYSTRYSTGTVGSMHRQPPTVLHYYWNVIQLRIVHKERTNKRRFATRYIRIGRNTFLTVNESGENWLVSSLDPGSPLYPAIAEAPSAQMLLSLNKRVIILTHDHSALLLNRGDVLQVQTIKKLGSTFLTDLWWMSSLASALSKPCVPQINYCPHILNLTFKCFRVISMEEHSQLWWRSTWLWNWKWGGAHLSLLIWPHWFPTKTSSTLPVSLFSLINFLQMKTGWVTKHKSCLKCACTCTCKYSQNTKGWKGKYGTMWTR
jgi:hypothetical protein